MRVREWGFGRESCGEDEEEEAMHRILVVLDRLGFLEALEKI